MRLKKKLEGKNEKNTKEAFLSDFDSDKDISKHNKKSLPSPPSVPFTSKQIKKNEIKETERELNNPMVSYPPHSKMSYKLVMNVN